MWGFVLLLLSGCASESGALDLSGYADLEQETPAHFRVCHGYGCHFESDAYLSDAQWQSVRALFQPDAKDAEAERGFIKKAVALMEDYVGEAVGTQTDKAGAGFIMSDSGQMDCIDEALNTSRYLHFFDRDHLLKHHSVESPTRRGYFVDGAWPHNSAVIKDLATEQRYVVDSWFYENGREPVIVPVEQWLSGWRPDDAP
ncbi:MAG: hypothetical protein H6867_11520 [Rhodospirillales bacterium]|nr:hypothetical protein [Rhodospirillales bacterium]MCB9996759.1 hypothetical protein [Rhodospirillales bacterium]